MPEPIEFLVIQNLQTALRAITAGGTYFYTVASLAVKLDPNQGVEALVQPNGPRPFIVIEVKPDSWEMSPAKVLKLTMPVTVHWVHRSDQTNDASRMQTWFRGVSDVETAAALDITRGGLAFETRVTQRRYEEMDHGADVWAMVDMNIIIRRNYGKPNG